MCAGFITDKQATKHRSITTFSFKYFTQFLADDLFSIKKY